MKYEQFLYSRTLTRDYRWILVPQYLTVSQLNIMKDVFDTLLDKRATSLESENLYPTFFFELGKIVVLMRCRKTDFEDQHSRKVYTLEGITTYNSYRRHVWFSIPWLLSSHNSILNGWKELQFDNADRLTSQNSEAHSLNLNSFDVIQSQRSNNSFISQILKGKNVELSFDPQGYQQLINLVASPYMPYSNFAFGCTESILQVLSNIRISALLQNRMGIQSHTHSATDKISEEPRRERNTQAFHKPPSESSNLEPQSDPSDRFVPQRREYLDKQARERKEVSNEKQKSPTRKLLDFFLGSEED